MRIHDTNLRKKACIKVFGGGGSIKGVKGYSADQAVILPADRPVVGQQGVLIFGRIPVAFQETVIRVALGIRDSKYIVVIALL